MPRHYSEFTAELPCTCGSGKLAVTDRTSAPKETSLEQQSTYLLRSSHCDVFENALNALESFFEETGFFEDSKSLKECETALSFAINLIKRKNSKDSCGHVISADEIREMASDKARSEEEVKCSAWLAQNLQALSRAGMITHSPDYLTLRDLRSAKLVFKGLRLFSDKLHYLISKQAACYSCVTANDVLQELVQTMDSQIGDDRRAMQILLTYLRRMCECAPQQTHHTEDANESFVARHLFC